jgi:hypothetical protein
MKLFFNSLLFATITIFFLQTSTASAQNMVVNGGFEFTVGFLSPPDQGAYEYFAGTTTITGWNLIDTTTSSLIAAVLPAGGAPGFRYDLPVDFTPTSPDGGNYFAADGDPTYTSILQQSISGLTVGQQYTLSFYQGLFTGYSYFTAVDGHWQVGFGSDVVDSTSMHAPQNSSADWQAQSMTFTASSTTQLLSFMAVATPNEPPIVTLDGISLVAVPEPSGAVLIGTCGMLMLLRRSRR